MIIIYIESWWNWKENWFVYIEGGWDGLRNWEMDCWNFEKSWKRRFLGIR